MGLSVAGQKWAGYLRVARPLFYLKGGNMGRCNHRYGNRRCSAKAVETIEIQGRNLALCWWHFDGYARAFKPVLTLASGN